MEEEQIEKIQFRVVGIVTSNEFQRSQCYVERLFKSFSKKYHKPEIRPLLNVEWSEFILKIRRKIGKKVWELVKQVAVFANGEYLGDDKDLVEFISKDYTISLVKNFEKLGKKQLVHVITSLGELGRNFVYLTISIDERMVGSLLFQLYSDHVPRTCENFMRRCRKKLKGYAGTPIQRIVKTSWIQCAGWKLKHYYMPCENYIVHHDRRGVLSMCHGGKHAHNSTQFHISLAPTPWMDYKYVAFGQLIQGEEVLRLIENVPTYYEKPNKNIKIVDCGEFTFYPQPDEKAVRELTKYLETKAVSEIHEDVLDARDVPSVLTRRRYQRGLYFVETDLKSHLPFLHLPDYLLYLVHREKETKGAMQYEEEPPGSSDYGNLTQVALVKQSLERELKVIDYTQEERVDKSQQFMFSRRTPSQISDENMVREILNRLTDLLPIGNDG